MLQYKKELTIEQKWEQQHEEDIARIIKNCFLQKKKKRIIILNFTQVFSNRISETKAKNDSIERSNNNNNNNNIVTVTQVFWVKFTFFDSRHFK